MAEVSRMGISHRRRPGLSVLYAGSVAGSSGRWLWLGPAGFVMAQHSGVTPVSCPALRRRTLPITHLSALRGGRSLSSHASPLSTLLALGVFATDISPAKTPTASKVSVVVPAGGRSAPRGRNWGQKPMPSGNEGSLQRICVGRRASDSPHLTLTRADERRLFVECRGFVVEAPAPGLSRVAASHPAGTPEAPLTDGNGVTH